MGKVAACNSEDVFPLGEWLGERCETEVSEATRSGWHGRIWCRKLAWGGWPCGTLGAVAWALVLVPAFQPILHAREDWSVGIES